MVDSAVTRKKAVSRFFVDFHFLVSLESSSQGASNDTNNIVIKKFKIHIYSKMCLTKSRAPSESMMYVRKNAVNEVSVRKNALSREIVRYGVLPRMKFIPQFKFPS